MTADRIAKKRCCKITLRGGPYPECQRVASVRYKGKWYCKQHDPVAVEARRKGRNDKWDAEWAARRAAEARGLAIHAAERAVICAARAWVDFEGSAGDRSVELRAAVAELDRLEKV